MKKLLGKFIICSSILSASSTAMASDCVLYQGSPHDNGYQLSMSNGEAYHDFSNIMISSRRWVGYFWGMLFGGWMGYDESFDNQTSSAEVAPGCALYLYENANYTGKKTELANPISNSQSFTQNLHEIGIGDTVSSALCQCGNVFQPEFAK
ncbi:hypothetical protein [Spirobacillus cienkowskii]|uniref:hypothetical protein n=1 Tax=Spirobacillus cienkowskii TaxID=495820 RepID=UPI0030CB5550